MTLQELKECRHVLHVSREDFDDFIEFGAQCNMYWAGNEPWRELAHGAVKRSEGYKNNSLMILCSVPGRLSMCYGDLRILDETFASDREVVELCELDEYMNYISPLVTFEDASVVDMLNQFT